MDDSSNPLGGGGGGNRSSKEPGIHHANIQNKERALARLRNSFRKVELELEIQKTGEKLKTILVLMEVLPNSCYLFSNKKMRKNDTVVIQFTQPLSIEVKGRIRYSEQVNEGTAVQVEKGAQTFRTLVEFQLSSELERNAMKDFYQQVRDQNYVATQWHMYISDRMERTRRAKDLKVDDGKATKKKKVVSKLDEDSIATAATEEATGKITLPPGGLDQAPKDQAEAPSEKTEAPIEAPAADVEGADAETAGAETVNSENATNDPSDSSGNDDGQAA